MFSTLIGMASIRAGRLAAHRKAMNRSILLIVSFLVAYVAKVAWLGHEPLSSWSGDRLVTLRIHRSLVFTMLAAGALARTLGAKAASAGERSSVRRVHRWLGRVATGTGVAGLLTAIAVLVQMVDAAAGG